MGGGSKDHLTRGHLALAGALKKKQGKGFPYSLPSVGPGADSDVQAVNPQVTASHPPGGRLPLLSTRPASPLLLPRARFEPTTC